MTKEELLKGISEKLKKHETFLIENPDIFLNIQERLFKAIDDKDPLEDAASLDELDQDSLDDYKDYTGEEYGSDLFDSPDETEEDADYDKDGETTDDETARWLAEKEQEQSGQSADAPSAGEEAEQVDADQPVSDGDETGNAQKVKPKVSSSGYRDWQPKDKYKPEHEEAIKQYMEQGFSHREAERFAGAHEGPGNFNAALTYKVRGTEPSPKYLEMMKDVAHNWKREAEKKIEETASAASNPVKYASGKALAAHEEAHGDFKGEYDKFLESDDMKGLKGRERHKAIQSWKKQYNESNPEHREKAANVAESGKIFQTADQERAKRLMESAQAYREAGKASPTEAVGEFSAAAAGDIGNLTGQAAAQLVGGSKEEGGYTSGVTKDPGAVFREKHEKFIGSKSEKDSINRIHKRLSPEQQKRFSAITSLKNKGE